MDRMERLTLAAIVGLLVWQLFIPPVVGLTNGGDFGKVIGVFNLAAAQDAQYHWAPTTYRFDPKHHHWAQFYSSEIVLAALAVGLNWPFSKTGTFDLRFMGAVHGGVFVLALCLLFPLLRGLSRWKRVLIGALIAIIGCDSVYTLLYNSFYADAGAILFFLLALVLFLRTLRWWRRLDFAAFVLCAVLFVTAKAQHAILGLPIAVLAVYAFASAGRYAWAGIATAATLAATAFELMSVPAFYRVSGVYSGIFWSLLPTSKDVAGDLKALGLDDSFRRYIGTHGCTVPQGGMNDPKFVKEFPRHASYERLGWYYLTHPTRAYQLLRMGLDEGGRQRPTGGNFDPGMHLAPDAESRSLMLWSGLKRLAFFHRGTLCLGIVLALTAALVYSADRAGATALGVGFAAIALLDLLVSTLADTLDPIRHLMLFAAMFDIMLISTVALLPVGARAGRPAAKTAGAKGS